MQIKTLSGGSDPGKYFAISFPAFNLSSRLSFQTKGIVWVGVMRHGETSHLEKSTGIPVPRVSRTFSWLIGDVMEWAKGESYLFQRCVRLGSRTIMRDALFGEGSYTPTVLHASIAGSLAVRMNSR